MFYRIPMDRAIREKFEFSVEKDIPMCKEHGAMNAISKIEEEGKTYLWYRCPVCRIGVAYDHIQETNQHWFPHTPPQPHLKGSNVSFTPPDCVKGKRFTIVGSYALYLHGYNITPRNIDVLIEEGEEVEACEVRGHTVLDKAVITPQEYRDAFIHFHLFDDEKIKALAQHAVQEPRILELFKNTEIMFVLQTFVKELKG